MKKLIALLLVAVMCLPLMACNNESGDTETPSSGENTKPNSDNNQSESEKELQKKYNSVMNAYNHYATYGNTGTSDYEELSDVYQALKELGDYKDSAECLSKILVVPDALTKITYNKTDNFGQTTEYIYKNFYYHKNGECVYFIKLFNLIEWDGMLRSSSFDYEYDNSRISGIHIYDDKTRGKINFEYDSNDNVISATVQTATRTYTNTYTYDENNRLLTADILGFPRQDASGDIICDSFDNFFSGGVDSRAGKGYKAEYEYDNEGRLTKVTQIPYSEVTDPALLNDACCFVFNYIYDDKNMLAQTKLDYYWDYTCEWINPYVKEIKCETYTYDENGKIISVEITAGQNTTTHIYHYETIYIYTGEN